MIETREYMDDRGRSPFGRWFNDLDARAVVRVRTSLAHMEAGNLSNVRGVGRGVLERRINVGPSYRVYFGRDGDTLIVLLGGVTKVRQQGDIERARELWQEYRRRKQQEVWIMPLTRDFNETVQARAACDPAFREGLLKEGVERLLAGDVYTGKIVLRDYINATIGFEELGSLTNKPPKSLMRMFGPSGNPHARNLFEVISHIQQHEGVRLEVNAVR